MKKNEKPGVMLYFDTMRALEKLDNEDKGILLQSILDYGQFGIEPDFGEPLCWLWPFVRMNLDRDTERYQLRCSQGRYGNYVRYLPDGQIPLSFEEWREICDE